MKVSIPKIYSIKWKNGAHADNVYIYPSRIQKDVQVNDILCAVYEVNPDRIAVVTRSKDGQYDVWGNYADHKEMNYALMIGANLMMNYDL